jgi:hypothetical protein
MLVCVISRNLELSKAEILCAMHNFFRVIHAILAEYFVARDRRSQLGKPTRLLFSTGSRRTRTRNFVENTPILTMSQPHPSA